MRPQREPRIQPQRTLAGAGAPWHARARRRRRKPAPNAPGYTKRGAVLTSTQERASQAQDLEVGIHWLAATTQVLDIDHVLDFIAETLDGADFEVIESGVSGYTRTYKTLYNLRIFINEKRPEMGVHMIADGHACESLGYNHLQMLFLGMQMKATRLDLATDNCPFTPAELQREWIEDNVRTACKPMRDARQGWENVRTCKWESSPTGDTFYMGSRQSTAFARCYDKRGFTRFELELKAERADKAAQLILAHPEQLIENTVGMIREFVDFVDASEDSNRSRCSFLPFWQKFIKAFERVKVQLTPRPELTLERLKDWIEGQVAPSLALYEMAFGNRDSYDDVDLVVSNGQKP